MKKLIRKIKYSMGIHRKDPLEQVPEFQGRMGANLRMRDGNCAMGNQVVADQLLFAVQYVAGCAVAGDIAEFGCMSGRTANVLSAAMASFKLDRTLHLFDSFEGLPEATSKVDADSVHVKGGVWTKGACLGISPELLREQCRRFLPDEKIAIYKGWYSETVSKIPAGAKFGMVHVDCDLYQSTMDSLGYLFANGAINKACVILFDDWNCAQASNAHGERKAWAELVKKYSIEAEDYGSYGWVGHKFIVHGYSGLKN